MIDGIDRFLRIERNTRDLARASDFYRDALGFSIESDHATPPAWTQLSGMPAPTRCARLSLGAQHLTLTEFPDAQPYPEEGLSCDLGFQHCAIVVNDMPAACQRALAHGAVPITRDGPQLLPPSTGSVTAWKFRDPDGHPLELIAFPAGSGDPAWQSVNAGTMLGIDHSAISVGDTAHSIAFYATLGLQVAARGVNQGAAQQRLDELPDVEVDVVALQAVARTPHLELLGYRRPRGRVNSSTDMTAIAADRIAWQVGAADALLAALEARGFPNATAARGSINGATIALLRDPDGHRLLLEEPAAPIADD